MYSAEDPVVDPAAIVDDPEDLVYLFDHRYPTAVFFYLSQKSLLVPVALYCRPLDPTRPE